MRTNIYVIVVRSGKLLGSHFTRVLSFVVVCCANQVWAQPSYSTGFRVYMDNDFFAFRKQDGAYTNGLRVDYWHLSRKESPTHLLRPFRSKTWKKTVRYQGLSIMQTMFTANNTGQTEIAPGDYPYSGALFATYHERSINVDDGRSVNVEYLAGVRGPYSLAAETQIGFHRLIGDPIPLGWRNQLPTALLVNLNVSKQDPLGQVFGKMRLFVRYGVKIGTLVNAVGVSFRATFNQPHMPGFAHMGIVRRHKFQCNLYFFPEFYFVVTNALLEGSITAGGEGPPVDINHAVLTTTTGSFVRYQRLGMSVSYKTHTGLVRDQPHKSLGNISFYFLFDD